MEAIGEFFKGASIGAACGAVGTIVASAATSIVGFTSSGVAAGSLAAGLQASVGNVAAGSLFAGMQTIGATGAIIGYSYVRKIHSNYNDGANNKIKLENFMEEYNTKILEAERKIEDKLKLMNN